MILPSALTSMVSATPVAALITNDGVVFGILTAILAFVFWTSNLDSVFWRRFYTFIPTILVCYFLPSVLSTFGVIDPEQSKLYFVASRYLLPASLVLLTLSTDLGAVFRLGPKALILFFTGTVGIVIGGPIAILIASAIAPDLIGGEGPEAVWRGMTTIAGSWIGGGANQAAMKEIFQVDDDLFGAMVAVDVIVANMWMAVLLISAGFAKRIDAATGADASAIVALQEKVEAYQASITRVPMLPDLMMVLFAGFGATAVGHLGADLIVPFLTEHAPGLERFSLLSSFFWLVVIATTLGLILSFTRARALEGVGASRVGSVFIYILVATIGMQMDLMAVVERWQLFLVGMIWMSIHAGLLLLVAWLIKAPVFFLAVGSQANVGGAASAPIVAAAFHPTLAPVGVLLAVVGYGLGTYAAYLCGLLMQLAAGG
jgi:uncharacterized membrane protein